MLSLKVATLGWRAAACHDGKRKADEECEGEADGKCMKQEAETPEEYQTYSEGTAFADPPAVEGEAAPADGVYDPAVMGDMVTELVDCPPTMVGRLIGKAGETIRTLEVCGLGLGILEFQWTKYTGRNRPLTTLGGLHVRRRKMV
jgi:hypothetical protein